MIPRSDITGLILAGGRGRRMNGDDKGLLTFQGRPLIAHVIETLAPQVGPLLISANRHLARYANWGRPVIADRYEDFRGPLAGIASGLAQVATPYLMVAPCDTPFLPAHLVERLAAALETEPADAAVAFGAGRMQALCVLLSRELEADLSMYLADSDRSATGWLRRHRHLLVDFSDEPRAFVNINTPRDLAAAG
ncbi:MAG: molybdenum cofactor guanylyltransferase MobA [Pseudomonadota bacterium]